MFEKRPKYVGNDVDLWCLVHGLSILETAYLSWKWLKNLTKGLSMWEMTYIFGNWLKCLRNV